MTKLLLPALCLLALPALAQDDLMPWQTDASFAALSDTALAITGDISLSGTDVEKTLTTQGGTDIGLTFFEDRSSGWSLADNEVWPGAVFSVDDDPGALENGNALCGGDPASYIVFTPIEGEYTGPYLQLAVFSGPAPENIESEGLCGTLNYALD